MAKCKIAGTPLITHWSCCSLAFIVHYMFVSAITWNSFHRVYSFRKNVSHYRDVIISAMASHTTGVSIAYSTVCPGADQRIHQSSASLAFVRGIHRWPVNSPHKGPVTQRMFPFDDVIMLRIYSGISPYMNRPNEGTQSYSQRYSWTRAGWNILSCRTVVALMIARAVSSSGAYWKLGLSNPIICCIAVWPASVSEKSVIWRNFVKVAAPDVLSFWTLGATRD